MSMAILRHSQSGAIYLAQFAALRPSFQVNNSFFDIEILLFDIENSFFDIENSLLDIENTLLDIEKPLLDIEKPLLYIQKWGSELGVGCMSEMLRKLVASGKAAFTSRAAFTATEIS